MPVDARQAPAPAKRERRPRSRDLKYTERHLDAHDWWLVTKRTAIAFNRHNVMSLAGSVTFFTLLAFVPAVAAFVSLYGLFADVTTAVRHMEALAGLLPPSAFTLISEQAMRLAGQTDGELSAAFGISLAVSLWSANNGIKSLIEGLNVVKETQETRSFIWLNVVSLTFTLGALFFLMLAISTVIIMPAVIALLGNQALWETLLLMARWPILATILITGIGIIYRYGPAPPRAIARLFTIGGVVAVLIWVSASSLFSWYVSSFGNYNQLYGPLSAIVIFMTWIWISTMVILLGAELDAEVIRQRRGEKRQATSDLP